MAGECLTRKVGIFGSAVGTAGFEGYLEHRKEADTKKKSFVSWYRVESESAQKIAIPLALVFRKSFRCQQQLFKIAAQGGDLSSSLPKTL